MTEHPITVRFGIVCDQVRREDNGKFLIIGAYGHSIGVATFPTHMFVTLAIGMYSKTAITDYPVEVRTLFNGEQIHGGKGTINSNEAGADFLIVPNILVSTDSEGELDFRIKLGSDRWKSITTIPLRKRA